MKTATLQLVVLIVITACLSSQERYRQIRVPVSSRQDVISLARLGISLEGSSRKNKDHVEIFVSEQEVQVLKSNGINFTTLIPDWNKYYLERQKKDIQPTSVLLRNSPLTNFHLGSMGGFLTYEELRTELDSMRAKYPALITARDSIGASYENRPIWALRISKNSIPGSQPQALYMGVHHANEGMAMMSIIYYMWYLLENYGTDPEVTTLLESRELWFIPLVNPDGYCYNQKTNPAGGGQWRKNRRPNAGGTYGVDLNRNYGYKWGYNDIGSSSNSSWQNYRGTGPFSEPETQAIRDFIKAHQFKVALTYHAYGEWLMAPWSFIEAETPDSSFFRELEKEMTTINRYSYGTAAEIYTLMNGEACDWMYGDTLSKPKIFPFDVEVGADVDEEWPQLSRILPLVMEDVQLDLMLARAATAYIRVNKLQVVCRFNNDSAFVSVPFTNLGAGVQPDLIDVTVTSPDLDIATTHFSGYAWNTLGPLNILGRKNKPVGTKASMSFEINYQNGKVLDTLIFRLGPADTIYSDNAEGTRSRWLSVSNTTMRWDTTSEQSHSGCLSFSESPHSLYSNNLSSSYTLDSALILKGFAELRFWLKGSCEVDYDCLRAEVSTNHGSAWNALGGRYTSPGSGAPTEQPFGSPVLDGYKYEWVEEVMDLGEYVGDTLQIRFRFTSDNGNQFGNISHDGFYIDDISVISYGNSLVSVQANEQLLPSTYSLFQNYPNPFNPTTTIKYQLPLTSNVSLKVFDLLGRELETLVQGEMTPGEHQVTFDATRYASGVYFYRLKCGSFVETKKLILLR